MEENMMAVPSPEVIEEVLGKTIEPEVIAPGQTIVLDSMAAYTPEVEDAILTAVHKANTEPNGEFISERNRIINKLTKSAKRRKMAKKSKQAQRKKK
jgi:hypothetical protein